MTKVDDFGVGGANKKSRAFFTLAVFVSWMPDCFLMPESKSLMAIGWTFPDY